MESICATIYTLILLLPLVLQLHMLILNPKKLCTIFHYYATNTDDNGNKPSSPKLLQHYPKQPIVLDVESESKISLTNLRTVSSSPVVPRAPSTTETGEEPSKSLLLAVKHSCTFVQTNQVLPVVDISWNYNSYRHRTFEQCLRNLYGDRYPPGEVLLNSMQLNLLDSRTNVSGVADLFDFVKDSELTLNGAVSRRPEIEYLDPLDHFVTKLSDRPCTEDRFTETLDRFASQDQPGSSDDIGSKPEPIRGVIIGREKNRRSCRKIEPCKCNLSTSVGRVYGNHDFQPGRKHPDLRGSGFVGNGSIKGRV